MGCAGAERADRADARYQPHAGQRRKGRETIGGQGIFGHFQLARDYYDHAGKDQGHSPTDAALGLEVGHTPALAKLIGLEGADEPTCLKAERHLEQTGGIAVSARQIQRVVQRVGGSAQVWPERQRPPGDAAAPLLYVSADGTGVPMAAPVPQQIPAVRGQHRLMDLLQLGLAGVIRRGRVTDDVFHQAWPVHVQVLIDRVDLDASGQVRTQLFGYRPGRFRA